MALRYHLSNVSQYRQLEMVCLHDVIVAGAGPAGNVAALHLAGLGYDTLVIDFRKNLGDKLCTGIIGRECALRYPPHPGDVYHAAISATVVAPSGAAHYVDNPEPQAYVINRVRYVASLAERAKDAGASFRLAERIVAVQNVTNFVRVSTKRGDQELVHEAKALVVASGFASPLLRMVKLDRGPTQAHMIGCQAVVEANGLDQTEVYVGDSIAPGSFGWLVPMVDDRALVGVVSRGKLNGHLDNFITDLQDSGKVDGVLKAPKRWGIPIRPLPKTYAERVLVVGDAAGLVKPTTGGGIYYAILSGEIAASVLHQAFSTNDLSEAQLSSYEAEWKRVIGKELKMGFYARRLFESLSDPNRERLLNQLLSARVQRELINSQGFSFDWHSGVIVSILKHSELGQAIRSFGPIVTPFLSKLQCSSAS